MSDRLRPNFQWFTPFLLLGSTAYLFINLFAFLAIPFLLSGEIRSISG